VRLGLPVGLKKKKTQKFAVHAGGCACDGEKNVLIVSVLLPIAIDLALRSNMQRRVDVVWVGQTPILQGVAATPIMLWWVILSCVTKLAKGKTRPAV